MRSVQASTNAEAHIVISQRQCFFLLGGWTCECWHANVCQYNASCVNWLGSDDATVVGDGSFQLYVASFYGSGSRVPSTASVQRAIIDAETGAIAK